MNELQSAKQELEIAKRKFSNAISRNFSEGNIRKFKIEVVRARKRIEVITMFLSVS